MPTRQALGMMHFYGERRGGRPAEDVFGGSVRANSKANATQSSKASSESTPEGGLTKIIDFIGLPVNSIGRVCWPA